MKRELMIVTAAALLWTAGIVAAPLLHGTLTSELLYRSYSVVCHQFEDRSFHVAGAPFGVCIRCSAVYIGFTAALLLLVAWDRFRTVNWNTHILLAVTAVPMALDGTADHIGLWQSTAGTRIATGALFGAGLAMLLHADLSGILHSIIQRKLIPYGTKER
ncbi:MAG: DUF2085 domain-containing protein [Bacteroidetes bacterium]|nr:DUF2085 domain-containing protein [Bacteroidota bacterium]